MIVHCMCDLRMHMHMHACRTDNCYRGCPRLSTCSVLSCPGLHVGIQVVNVCGATPAGAFFRVLAAHTGIVRQSRCHLSIWICVCPSLVLCGCCVILVCEWFDERIQKTLQLAYIAGLCSCAPINLTQYEWNTQSCSNPYPAHGGLLCVGNTIQTTSCDVTPVSSTLDPTSDATTEDSPETGLQDVSTTSQHSDATTSSTASGAYVNPTVSPTTGDGAYAVGGQKDDSQSSAGGGAVVAVVVAVVVVVLLLLLALALRAAWRCTHGHTHDTAPLAEPRRKRVVLASTASVVGNAGAPPSAPKVGGATPTSPLAVRNLSFQPDNTDAPTPEKMLTAQKELTATHGRSMLPALEETTRHGGTNVVNVQVYDEAEC